MLLTVNTIGTTPSSILGSERVIRPESSAETIIVVVPLRQRAVSQMAPSALETREQLLLTVSMADPCLILMSLS